jgi:hypothetical protein
MARNWRWEEPIQALSLGIVEVLHDDRVVAVGRVSLTNARDGTMDFAARCERPAGSRRPA